MKNDHTTSTTDRRLEWWREARFGMFIHWGLYAVPAGVWQGRHVPKVGEWLMFWEKIPATEYAKLADTFDPAAFDADAVVRLARDAGMRYVVVTAKHHDGFAMYDSPSSPYNIVDATPYSRDPMKDLAAACARYGLRLCFYYSQDQDWHHPGGSRNDWDYPPDEKDFAGYLETKVKPQLRELLTHYGPIGLIWFDTPCSISADQSRDLKQWVQALQPDCLVSGRVGHGVGDYGCLHDNQHPAMPLSGDWETPCTLNNTWGYKRHDHEWKSTDYLIRLLVNCVAKGVNYLLNIGPTGTGIVPAPSITRLQQIGDWMDTNGEAIHGAGASPFPCEFQWGAITSKGNTLYLHVFRWPAGSLHLAGLRTTVKRAYILGASEAALAIDESHDQAADDHRLSIRLHRRKPTPRIPVVALEMTDPPDVAANPQQHSDGSIHLPAYTGTLVGGESEPSVDRDGSVLKWDSEAVTLSWQICVRHPGVYDVIVLSMLDRERPHWYGDHDVAVTIGETTIVGRVGKADMLQDPRVSRRHQTTSLLGTIRLETTGQQTVTLRCNHFDPSALAGFTTSGLILCHTRARIP